jgi:hypothetical protein
MLFQHQLLDTPIQMMVFMLDLLLKDKLETCLDIVSNSTPFLVGVHIPFVFTWCIDAFDNLIYCI